MPRPKTMEPDPIAGLLLYYSFDAQKLAKVWRCCETTARSKLKRPEKITIQELRQLNRAGVPIDRIREAIK